ncbi:PAS domain-containing hybrid sensor histidine kinase/response regulator [Mucilaginibacter myungsuensis]|uniref:histidine kinase n=1 Tax=Mucilaginibacter myungsuensis TaxID=649104 RepID=A0A929L1Q8_9SPHI|nr:PAS domain-containing hybrid sensor histidine kinase/response regulator [Mucilaginibacter myungsuensis]MBE9664528.1 PAS domain S-box protein [Mucilaginibacter myungsuensis]MDN3601327.1 PAS domain S-box protein [Mucilaginibacter myungsuensis]
MYAKFGNIPAVPNGISTNILILAGFALVLIIAGAVMLLIKFRRLRKEDEGYDDDDASGPNNAGSRPFIKLPPLSPPEKQTLYNEKTPASNVAQFTAAISVPEPRTILRPVVDDTPAPTPIVPELVKPDTIVPTPVAVTETEIKPISDAKNIALLKSLNEVNAVISSLSDVVFEYDEDQICVNLWYNKLQPGAAELERFRGKKPGDLLAPDTTKALKDAIDISAANGVSTDVEFRSFYGDGKWSRAYVSPVFDKDNVFTGRTTALIIDITAEREEAEKAGAEYQRALDAQKVAKLGDWWYDLATKETYWADNLYKLLDIDALPKGTTHFEYYASSVVSEDRRAVYQFFADVEGKQHNESQHGITTAKGNSRYFRIVRGEPVRNAQGNITRVTGIIQDITENKSIERTIKRSQAELSEAQSAAKIGNWKWYLGQKNISWSDEVYHIYEVDPSSLKTGLSHFKLLLQYVHPEDKVILLTFLKNPANLRRTSYEFRIITPTGKLKFLSLIIAKIKDGEDGSVKSVMGTLQDVTDRKRAELNIRETEDNYKEILDGVKLAAVSLDRNGNILFCNKYLAGLLGYPQSKLVGLKWYEQFISENLQPVFAKWAEDSQAEPNYINPVICRNGEERVISWQNTTIYDEDGQIKQITCIGEDVTDQQKDRQQLIDAKNDAERASMFKSEFLSTMSHEIRTPMNAVIGTTELLLEENPRADQIGYLNTLKFSGENLLGIINDILDYNKIEAGKLELTRTQLNINKLVDNIKQSFAAKAAEKKLSINIEMANTIPQNITGDPIRITQILNNLVSNAIKFTHKGGITILIREDSRTENKVKLNFTVADTGIGIEPKNLDKIFEPFVQESQERRDYGGSGLGLAIIKRLIQLHGSDIKASSALGKGTQFNFVIEFEYQAEPVKKPVLNAVQKMQEGDLSGMKVLVVDDNKMNILIASRFLNKWHINISEANNGLVATQMAENNDYDLILMDLQMPVMDGFEATQIIKSKQPRLPIIALTADAMPETFAKTRNYGMDDYLTKPFMPEILFEKIARHYRMAV